jgi:hypothetical protein
MHLQTEARAASPIDKRSARRWRIVLAVAAVPVVLVVAAQLLLPSLAADKVRSKAAKYGRVESVKLSAWPAVELLWGKADSAEMKASTMAISPAQMASLMWEARGVGSMTVRTERLKLLVPALPEGLTVTDAVMRKHGSDVRASAIVTQAQLDEALPNGFRVQPLSSGPEGVLVRASGGLFGGAISLNARLLVSGGHLIAEPQGLPFAALATVTLFADQHLQMKTVALDVVRRQPLTYGLALTATLR